MARPRFLPDTFTLAIAGTVVLASLLPASGSVAVGFALATKIAITTLFFLHGARLSREAIVAGMTHVRLHAVILVSTFVMFPLVGFALRPVLGPLVTPELYSGVLFLCALPSTVQSSIALTSIARGNVPAAVCSASASSLIGVFVTPMLVGALLARSGARASLDSVRDIVTLLLLPFVVGHLSRPLVGGFLRHHAAPMRLVDQGSILLAVYTAFSASVNQGLWRELPLLSLLGLTVVCFVLLGIALFLTRSAARALRFPVEDEITIVLCGSKKSLATGIPMANVLFAGSAAGPIVLPLMLYHQIQLMVCAYVAQRYAARPDPGEVSRAG